MPHFTRKMRKSRARFFPESLREKEYAYKDLRIGSIRASLPDYLAALDAVPGLLFTVVTDKNVPNLFRLKSELAHARDVLDDLGFGRYSKTADSEKTLAIIHVAAYLVALLSWKEQRVFWMTDHDAIVPKSEQHENVLRLFAANLQRYSRYRYARIGGATPFSDGSTEFLDYLSAADLAAGAVSRLFQREVEDVQSTVADPATDDTIRWLGRQGIGLKKYTMRISRGGAEAINYASYEFRSEPGPGAIIIEIVR